MKLISKFISRDNWFYRFQQLLILIAHLLLLKWILWVLAETNQMQATTVFMHFTGLAIAGGGLIYGCAMWAKHHHLKELKQQNSEVENND